MTFSLCLSVFDVYPGLTQSCFKPCIIYILPCSQGCSENYLTCFLMLLLGDQCQTKYYKIHVIQKQHNSTTKRWWLSCFIYTEILYTHHQRVTDNAENIFWTIRSSTIWAENERSQCALHLLHFMVLNHLWELLYLELVCSFFFFFFLKRCISLLINLFCWYQHLVPAQYHRHGMENNYKAAIDVEDLH